MSMKTVTVNRIELIGILRQNLEKHVAEYEEAMIGYRIAQEAALKKALQYFRKHGRHEGDEYGRGFHIVLSMPTSQEAVYRQAIDLLEHSVNDTQELDLQEFEQLVRDNWTWTNQFKNLTSNYGAIAGASKR